MKIKYLYLVGLVLVLMGCQDFVEKDITGDTPVVLFPTQGDTITKNAQFSWTPLNGATKYRLEIYYPNFTNPSSIILDSVISQTNFFVQLPPNHYQYRLTALNNGYISKPLGPIDFFVDTAQGGNYNITLLSPIGGIYKNASFDGKFTWVDLSNELSYEFSLRKGTNFSTGQILVSTNQLSSAQYTVSGIDFTESDYIWGVKAYFSGGGESVFFTGTFKVDTTNPVTPSLSLPADLSSGTSPIAFSWTQGSDVGSIKSPVYSFLELSQTNNFSSITSSDSTNTNSLSIPITPTGIYYWRVYNKDMAGNMGAYSATRQITVN